MLGNYGLGEAHSIVVLYNASIHNDLEVRRLIASVGAELVMSSPYSPDLNHIKKIFSVYKASLHRNTSSGKHWYKMHEEGLSAVTPAIAYSEFKHCGVPMKGAKPPASNDDDNFIIDTAFDLICD